MTQARTVVTLQVRRGTNTEWNSADPTLAVGELGYNTTNGKFKIGNGTTPWTTLSYAAVGPWEIAELAQDAIAQMITEGSNLGVAVNYDDGTNTFSFEVEDQFLVHTTDDLEEGTTNKYFTELRAQTAVAQDIADAVSGAALGSTDDLTEGTTNLYFTDQRAKDAVAGDISTAISNLVGAAPGLLDTLNELAAAINDDENFAATVAQNITDAINALGTDDIEEGTTNLYFTNQRALDATTSAYDHAGSASTAESNANTYTDTEIDNLTTDDIEEGVTHEYFTAQRAKDAAADLITNATLSNISITGSGSGLTITAENGVSQSTTTDLVEGTNLYFTAQRALDATASAYDAAGAAASAQSNAESTASGYVSTHAGLTEAHGATGAVVGTTNSQTLTNKTIDTADNDITVVAADVSDFNSAAVSATASSYDAAGSAATAEQNAKDYADGLASNYEPAGAINTAIDAITTSVIEEGANLYFTTERAQDAIGNWVGPGLEYNDTFGAIGVNPAAMLNQIVGAVSGNSYGLVGTSTYLDVKDTNGYNKEIELDIAAVESQLDTDGYITLSSTSTLTNKTLTSPKINEDVALTATATELNTLDGITASTEELNILDGITASTSELNILDGATLSTTELNYVGGVTSAIQDQIDLKAPLASPTFTGTVQAGDISSSGNLSVDGTITVDGNLVVGGTTTTIHTATISTRDNLVYLNEALDLPLLGATHNTTTVEYEVADNVDVVNGMAVRVTGVTPSDYNISSSDNVTVVSKRSSGGRHYFTVTKTVTVSYTSGGTAHLKNDANPDLGFAGGYYSSGYAHAGFFRDASDGGKFKVFQGYTPEPDETAFIDTTHASFALAPIAVSSIEATSATIGDVTNTELQYVHGVTSAIQTQIDSKFASADASTTNITEGTNLYFTDERAQDAVGNAVGTGLTYTDSTGEITVNTSVIQERVTGVSDTEIGYLDGVTSAIQTQLDAKLASSTAASTYAPLDGPTFTGTVSGITKSMVGLGNVDNTTDANKPVSSATQTALDAKLDSSTASSTYAPINAPTFTGTVSGITKSMVGLGNVDNTTDANKPVSTATQTALDLKANLSGPTFTGTVVLPSTTSIGNVSATELGYVDGVTSAIQTQLDAKLDSATASSTYAPIAGPTFTGTVAAPTPSTGDDSTKVATTAYVQAENIVQYVPLSGTTLTIASATHKFKTIVCNSSSATTISIPTDASDNWPIGSYVNVRQMGTGQVTVAAVTSGTTSVVATDSQFKTRVQYSEIVLEKTAINTWLVAGDTTA